MIWLNPAALVALVAVAAPILVHILVQRRAERFPFPTLRFLKPTRLAAIRRRVLEDVPLLAVRVAILVAAVIALAGPLIVTAARRQAWERRLVRAVVSEGARAFSSSAREPRERATEDPPRFQREGGQASGASDLSDAIRRAVAWLDNAPPARRELVIASPLAIGSVTAADIAGIPADIGVRFERSTTTLPQTRTVPFGRLLTANGPVDREVMLSGSQTSVSASAAAVERDSWPIEIVAPPEDRADVDAAKAAVLTERVWAPPAERRANLVVLARDGAAPQPAQVRTPWIADAIARIAGDADLRNAAARLPGGMTGASVARQPWQTIAAAADGRPVAVAAAAGDRLLVASSAPARDLVTPLLMRSIANALAPAPDVRSAEVVPIADAVLAAWSRPSSLPAAPRIGTLDEDDRRWLWAAVLLLLAVETLMRRARRRPASDERALVEHGDTTRVA